MSSKLVVSTRHSRTRFVIALNLVVIAAIIAAFLIRQPTPLTPVAQLNQSWQRVQQAGQYAYITDLSTVQYPSAALSSAGRPGQEQHLSLRGKTDLDARTTELTLMPQVNPTQPAVFGQADGLEIRIEGDQAYRRVGQNEWQPVDNLGGAFAPSGDALAFVAAAREVQALGQQTLNGQTYAHFTFRIDGPALAAHVRTQMEDYLRKNGQLPPGISLGESDAYKAMLGNGELWLDGANMPARLKINATFPERLGSLSSSVAFQTEFTDYAALPVWWRASDVASSTLRLATRELGSIGITVLPIASLLAALLWVALVHLRTPLWRKAVSVAMMAMLVSGSLHVNLLPALAYLQKNHTANAQSQQQTQAEDAAKAKLSALTAPAAWNASAPATEQLPTIKSATSTEKIRANTLQALPLAQTAATASTACATASSSADTDTDGLSDLAECKLGTDPKDDDTDNDGLTDGMEQTLLGLDPTSKDTDFDSLEDGIEVNGWLQSGTRFYTNPLELDTNGDGVSDGEECPAQRPKTYSPSAVTPACADSDSDGRPNAFEFDNDADGIGDGLDFSRDGKLTGYSAAAPFKLKIDSLTADKPVLVRMQLVPNSKEHLTFSQNVLEWPAGDQDGQVQTIVTRTTFASVFGNNTAPDNNGNLRLLPMLEVKLTGDYVPLARVVPSATVALALTNTVVTATFAVPANNANTAVQFSVGTAQANLSVRIAEASACNAYSAQASSHVFSQTVSGASASATLSKKLLSVLNGSSHVLVLEQANGGYACRVLPDLPNGRNDNLMFDTARLQAYGVSLSDLNDASKTTIALAPLNIDTDPKTGQRQAFSAQMPYRQSANQWGDAQEMRIVWMVQLAQPGGSQVIHNYYDDFNVGGLSVQEDRGTLANVVLANPSSAGYPNALSGNLTQLDVMYALSNGLDNEFINRKAKKDASGKWLPQATLTLSDMPGRFNGGGVPTAQTWGITPTLISVVPFTFTEQTELAYFATRDTRQLLDARFGTAAQRAANPTLLFMFESKTRNLSLDNDTGLVTTSGGVTTFAMSADKAPEIVAASYRWTPFRYVNNSWDVYPMDEFFDALKAQASSLFTSRPIQWMDTRKPAQMNGAMQVVQAVYLNNVSGKNSIASIGAEQIVEQSDEFLDAVRTRLDKASARMNDLTAFLFGAIVGLDHELSEIKSAYNTNYGLDTKLTALTTDKAALVTSKATLETELRTLSDNLDAVDDAAEDAKTTRASLQTKITEKQKAIDKNLTDTLAKDADITTVTGQTNDASLTDTPRANAASKKAKLYGGLMLGLTIALAAVSILASITSGVTKVVFEYVNIVLNTLKLAIDALELYNTLKSGFTAAVTTATSAVKAMSNLAKSMAVVGFAITVLAAAAVFFVMWAATGKVTGNMVSELAASIVVAAIMLALAFTGVGLIIIAIIGLIDAAVWVVCAIADKLGSDTKTGTWADFCAGITGNLTRFFQNLFYTSDIIVDMADSKHLSFLEMKPALRNPAGGYITGAQMDYALAVESSIVVVDSEDSIAYSTYRFDNGSLKKADYRYALALPGEEAPLSPTFESKTAVWSKIPYNYPNPQSNSPAPVPAYDDNSDRLYLPPFQLNKTTTFSQTGINVTDPLDLLERYEIPAQSCTVFVGCWNTYEGQEPGEASKRIPINPKWDVFPPTLDAFYTPFVKDGGYAFAWGQTTGDLAFPRAIDFDGDGLAWNVDPNDSTGDADGDTASDELEIGNGTNPRLPDTDGDGLRDDVELNLGSDPLKTDSDTDGLQDKAELDGWPFFAFTAKGALVQTWVRSSPLVADADGDGLSDKQEQIYGYHPQVKDVAEVLTMNSLFVERTGASLLIRFNESANASSFADDSGASLSGTCTPPACPLAAVAGRFLRGVQFDGADDVLTTAATKLSNSSFTVSFWANPNGSANGTPVAHGPGGFRAGFNGGAFACSVAGATAGGGSASPNTWSHFACAYDAEAKTLTAFTNGTQSGSVSVSAGYSLTAPLLIGQAFAGRLDDVAMFPSALNASQIANVRDGRINRSDAVAGRGEKIDFATVIKNELNNRTAQGLYEMSASKPALVASGMAPQGTFVLGPQTAALVSGTLNLASPTSSDAFSVTQSAKAQVIDRRALSDYAEVWLKADGGGSAALADSSGSSPARNGVCLAGRDCPTATNDGKIAGALDFNGNAVAQIDNVDLRNSSFTVAAWVKRNNSSGYDTIVGQGSGAQRLFFGIRSFSSYFEVQCGFNSSYLIFEENGPNTDSNWNHWVCTYDAQTGERQIFLNGERRNNDTTSDKYQGSGPLLVGNTTNFSNQLSGKLDDLRIFKRVLDNAAIRRLVESYSYTGVDMQGTGFGDKPLPFSAVTQATDKTGWQFDGRAAATPLNNAIGYGNGELTYAIWMKPTDVLPDLTLKAADGCTEAAPVRVDVFEGPRTGSTFKQYNCISARPNLAYNWGDGALSPYSGNSNEVTLLFSYNVTVNRSKTHHFSSMGDDATFLRLDGTEFGSTGKGEHWGTKGFDKYIWQGDHTLTVAYREDGGGATFGFWWDELRTSLTPEGVLGDMASRNINSVTAQSNDSGPALDRIGRKLRFSFTTTSGGWNEVTTPDIYPDDGQYHHVAVTYSPTNGAAFYIDGVQKYATASGLYGSLSGQQPRNTGKLAIGATARTGAIYMQGFRQSDGDDSGSDEVCMAWDKVEMFNRNMDDGDFDPPNTTNTFYLNPDTGKGTLEIWEDDVGTRCGGDDDRDDDHAKDIVFQANDLEKRRWDAIGVDSSETEGTLFLGNWGADHPQDAVIVRSRPYKGQLKYLRIYPKALTALEMTTLFAQYSQILNYRLDEPPGAGETQQGFVNELDLSGLSRAVCNGDATTCPTSGVNGRVQQAAKFDGINDALRSTSSPDMRSSFTLMTWAKRSGLSAAGKNYFLFGQGTAETNKGLHIGFRPDNKFVCDFYGNELKSDVAYTDTDWHHWACSYDVVGGWRTLFRDGVLVKQDRPGANLYQGSGPIFMGANWAGTADYFDGWLDEVRAYSSALPASDVLAEMTRATKSQILLDEPEIANSAPTREFRDIARTQILACAGANDCPVAGVKDFVGISARFNKPGQPGSVVQRIGVGTAADIGLDQNQYTVMAWVKPERANSAAVLGTSTDPIGFSFGTLDGDFALRTANLFGGGTPILRSNTKLLPGVWQHIAFRRNSSGVTALFLNGAPVASASMNAIAGSNQLFLGGGPDVYYGNIARFSVARTALSDNDLRNVYEYQARTVEDRVITGLRIDAVAPSSSLVLSSSAQAAYFANAPHGMAVGAQDADSAVQMVEVKADKASGGSSGWLAYGVCDGTGAAASFCGPFDPTALGGEGRYQLSTRATDGVGNQEASAAPRTVFVDGTAPNLTMTTPDGALLNPQVISASRQIASVQIVGTVSDPALSSGDAGSGVNPSELWVTLTSLNGTPAGEGKQRAAVSGATWTANYQFVGVDPTGRYTVTVAALDKVGNLRNVNIGTVKVDGSRPYVAPAVRTSSGIGSLQAIRSLVPNSALIVGAAGPLFKLNNAPVALGSYSGTLEGVASDANWSAGPMAWFGFDDAAGSQRALDGALRDYVLCSDITTCPIFGATGRDGRAASFDGSNDTLTLSRTIEAAQDWSVAFWMNTSCATCGLLEVSDGAQGERQLYLSGGNLVARLNGETITSSGLNLADGQWHHIVVRVGALGSTSGGQQMFVDGVRVAQGSQLNATFNANRIHIGKASAAGATFFNGTLDSLMIFKTPLLDEQIMALALGQVSGLQSAEAAFVRSQPTNYISDAPAAQAIHLPMDALLGEANVQTLLNVAGLDAPNAQCLGASCPTFALGKIDNAQQFAGTQSAEIAHNSAISPESELTFGAWFNAEGVQAEQVLFGKANGSSGGYALRIKDGKVGALVWDNLGVQNLVEASVLTQTWTHVAARWDAGVLSLFVNSANAASVTAAGGATRVGGNTSAFRVGAAPWASALGFVGALDEVRVFHAALSNAELSALDDVPAAFVPAAPVWEALTVSNARWAKPVPSGVEGFFMLHLRATDAFGLTSQDPVPPSNLTIDTLAPRVAFTREVATIGFNQTRLIVNAQDFDLQDAIVIDGLGGLGASCAWHNTDQYADAGWYLSRVGKSERRLLQRHAVCNLNVVAAQPITATVCDTAGQCTSVIPAPDLNIGAPDGYFTQTTATLLQPAEGAVFTTTRALSITGYAYTPLPDSLSAVQVLAGADEVVTQTFGAGVTGFEAFSTTWTAASDGVYTVTQRVTTTNGTTALAQAKIIVDITPPQVSVIALSPLALRGLVTEALQLDNVSVDVSGPVAQSGLRAEINGNTWRLPWTPPPGAPTNGETYTFTVTARDAVGFSTVVTAAIAVERTAPALSDATFDFNGVSQVVGARLIDPNLSAAATITPSDVAGIGFVWHRWQEDTAPPKRVVGDGVQFVDAGDIQTTTATSGSPAVLASALAVNVVNDGKLRYLFVGASDVNGNYAERVFGPFYHDTNTNNDYLGPTIVGGSDPYLGWMNNGCTRLGYDKRSGTIQNLYGTVDVNTIEYAWTGGNWDSDGDLWLYMDSPDVADGGATAYNPYPATQRNTLLLLPSNETAPSGSEVMKANVAVWVKDNQTAVLLRWNGTQWMEDHALVAFGEAGASTLGWFRVANVGGEWTTVIGLPKTQVGLGGSGYLFTVGFATEENALRTWASVPADNPATSRRINPYMPGVGEPLQAMFGSKVFWEPTASRCYPFAGGNLLNSLQADQAVDLKGVFVPAENRDYQVNPTNPWPALLSQYNADYTDWVNNTYCAAPANADMRACRASNKTLSVQEVREQLVSVQDSNHPPVQPGQVISFYVEFDYDGYLYTGNNSYWYFEFDDHGAGLQWANGCNKLNGNAGSASAHLINILPYTKFSGVMTATVGTQTVDNVSMKFFWVNSDAPNPVANGPCGDSPNRDGFGTREVYFTPDRTAPIVTVQSPDVADGVFARIQGIVQDASPVAVYELEIAPPGGGALTLACTDTTPSDGAWSCDWTIPASSDGDVYRVRGRATDPWGQVGAWSLLHPIVIDTTAPTVTVASNLAAGINVTDVTQAPLLGVGQTALSGNLDDNRALKSVEICDEVGLNCSFINVTANNLVVPPPLLTLSDVPTGGLAIAGCLVRTFAVSETFAVAGLQVGVNVAHPFRGDLEVKLKAPSGSEVTLLDDAGKIATNVDALFRSGFTEDFTAPSTSHDVNEPYYDVTRTPRQSLDVFSGQAANGTWTLTMCDRDAARDAGTFYRAELRLQPETTQKETSGAWSFGLPSTEGVDGGVFTYTLVGLDAVGNRAITQVLTVRVDMVAPLLTATQVMTESFSLTSAMSNTLRVLTGTVSDGAGLPGLTARVTAPGGVESDLAIQVAGDGSFAFDFLPEAIGQYAIKLIAMDAAGNATELGSYALRIAKPMQLSKQAEPSALFAGERVTYTLLLRNLNDFVVSNVVITDGVHLAVEANVPGGVALLDGVLTWPPISVTAQGLITLTYTALVTTSPQYADVPLYSAALLQASGFDTGNLKQTTLEETANAFFTMRLIPVEPITVSKLALTNTVGPGGVVMYALVFSNPNPSPVNSVVVTDVLPVGMSALAAVDVPYVMQPDGTLQWEVSLAASQVLTASFTVQISTDPIYYGATLTNTASFTSSGFVNASYSQAEGAAFDAAGVMVLTPTPTPLISPTPTGTAEPSITPTPTGTPGPSRRWLYYFPLFPY